MLITQGEHPSTREPFLPCRAPCIPYWHQVGHRKEVCKLCKLSSPQSPCKLLIELSSVKQAAAEDTWYNTCTCLNPATIPYSYGMIELHMVKARTATQTLRTKLSSNNADPHQHKMNVNHKRQNAPSEENTEIEQCWPI